MVTVRQLIHYVNGRWKVSCNLSVSQCVLQRCSTGITDWSARMLRICVDHMENWRSSTGLLTNSPMLIGLPMWVAVSRPGGISDVSLIELLQSSHTRSRESILKLRDMRQILVFLNNTSLTCATMHSQHRCTCVGNTLPRSGANHRTGRVQARGAREFQRPNNTTKQKPAHQQHQHYIVVLP